MTDLYMLETASDLPPLTPATGSPPDAPEAYARDDGRGCMVLASSIDTTADGVRITGLREQFRGGRVGPQGGDLLLRVGLWVPVEYESELVGWYRVEHLPFLLECPQWDGCRFVRGDAVTDGRQYYAIHQVSEPSALESAARRRSRETQWFRRLSRHDWFDAAFTRVLYRRIAP